MSTEKDFLKFLRTRHIFDAGGNGVSRDDLVLSSKESENFLRNTTLILEEKVDGANIGISIAENYQIKVQNRSHYVNSSTHKQFSTLDSWIEQHSEDLFSILKPERHVLFGEWLLAKHSIHYTSLPDYFLAFDVFDKDERRFLNISERNSLLEGTGIKYVHQICEETNLSKKRVRFLILFFALFTESCPIFPKFLTFTPSS